MLIQLESVKILKENIDIIDNIDKFIGFVCTEPTRGDQRARAVCTGWWVIVMQSSCWQSNISARW